jgi:hypothetical protein
LSCNRLAFKVESQDRRRARPQEGGQREHWRRAIDVEGDAEIAGMAMAPRSIPLGTALPDGEAQALIQAADRELKVGFGVLQRCRLVPEQQGSQALFRAAARFDELHRRADPERWGNDQIGLRPGSALPQRSGRYYSVTGAVGSGPVAFKLSQTERRTDDRARRHDERSYEATAILDLQKLRSAIGGDGFGDSVWGIAPRSAWASWAVGSVDPGNAATGTRDDMQSYGAGLSWWWGAGYADLGLWHYHYDSRQRGGEDADWLGQGMYGGLGLYGSTWSVDAGLALDGRS